MVSEQDINPKLLSWNWNYHIYGGTVKFQGRIPIFRSQDNGQKAFVAAHWLNLGILGSEQDNNPKLIAWKWNAALMGVQHVLNF